MPCIDPLAPIDRSANGAIGANVPWRRLHLRHTRSTSVLLPLGKNPIFSEY